MVTNKEKEQGRSNIGVGGSEVRTIRYKISYKVVGVAKLYNLFEKPFVSFN